MLKKKSLELTQIHHALRATLILRTLSVIAAAVTLPLRADLPTTMAYWYGIIAPVLFCINLAAIVFAKPLITYVKGHPAWLTIDLIFAIGIILIGGGWRSSYFEYTLTTIIVFTILAHRKGAYISAFILAVVSLVKNPLPEGDPIQIFQIDNWDMRLGASLFFVTAGLILGYFSTIIQRLNQLSEERIVQVSETSAIKQKIDLAFDLHDRLKSKLSAIMMVAGTVAQKTKTLESETAKDVRRLWQWLNHFQHDLDQLVYSLKDKKATASNANKYIDICSLIKEEIRIFSAMTGFSCSFDGQDRSILIRQAQQATIGAFISEALTNAWKHSNADCSNISLSQNNGQIRLAVMDEGMGFEPSANAGPNTSGLSSMIRRSEELKGHLEITSSPGRGCCCALTFSVARPNENQ